MEPRRPECGANGPLAHTSRTTAVLAYGTYGMDAISGPLVPSLSLPSTVNFSRVTMGSTWYFFPIKTAISASHANCDQFISFTHRFYSLFSIERRRSQVHRGGNHHPFFRRFFFSILPRPPRPVEFLLRAKNTATVGVSPFWPPRPVVSQLTHKRKYSTPSEYIHTYYGMQHNSQLQYGYRTFGATPGQGSSDNAFSPTPSRPMTSFASFWMTQVKGVERYKVFLTVRHSHVITPSTTPFAFSFLLLPSWYLLAPIQVLHGPWTNGDPVNQQSLSPPICIFFPFILGACHEEDASVEDTETPLDPSRPAHRTDPAAGTHQAAYFWLVYPTLQRTHFSPSLLRSLTFTDVPATPAATCDDPARRVNWMESLRRGGQPWLQEDYHAPAGGTVHPTGSLLTILPNWPATPWATMITSQAPLPPGAGIMDGLNSVCHTGLNPLHGPTDVDRQTMGGLLGFLLFASTYRLSTIQTEWKDDGVVRIDPDRTGVQASLIPSTSVYEVHSYSKSACRGVPTRENGAQAGAKTYTDETWLRCRASVGFWISPSCNRPRDAIYGSAESSISAFRPS
ncbi:hypothetical protein ACRALDRAFT_211599 [Sodiomyces alcalophilus JCM 7366]|uniref:uncharacterized protein n=1 Tax=Sodiomyces alcalophilus JCM 7366 TaxID=591952 RepID=UPI0039B5D2F6